tara:strand:+ start:24 stop:1007 length:984 start_codon:yes stop_codon:yes gene_type:complete
MLQLVLDKDGNYVYQDVVQKKTPSLDTTAFEAYEADQKTTLAGETDIGSQTKQLMRETPGQYTTTFNEQTGQFETKTKDTTPVTVDIDPVEQTTVAPQETALDKVSRISAASRPAPIDYKGIAQDTMQMFKPTFKEKVMDTALSAGKDIAVNYVTNRLLSSTFSGQLAATTMSTPMMANPAVAAATFALQSDAGKKVTKAVTKPIKKLFKKATRKFGTVICTELYKQNLMSKEDHEISWNFTIDNFSKIHLDGYWYWAVPMVKVMKKNKTVTKFWKHIMSNRTKDIKWRLNKGNFNLLGRLYSILIENGSYIIGKIIKNKKNKEVLA